jgi:rhodanese-related sulfurtransferase
MTQPISLSRSRLLGFALIFVVAGVVMATIVSHRVRAAETEAAVKAIADDAGHVTAGELAQWILEKRQDYQLIDLRDRWHFDDYHIPTAINIPFAELFWADNLQRIDRQKKVVVYGLGAGNAAQAQLLLAMKGYRAYSLEDGIIAWWDELMTPTSIRSARPSPSGYQQARQLREYFMTGGQAAAPATPPAPPAPAASPSTTAPAKAKAETPAKPVVKPAAKPAEKPAAKPAAKPAKPPVPDKEKDRLKLGTGCS